MTLKNSENNGTKGIRLVTPTPYGKLASLRILTDGACPNG